MDFNFSFERFDIIVLDDITFSDHFECQYFLAFFFEYIEDGAIEAFTELRRDIEVIGSPRFVSVSEREIVTKGGREMFRLRVIEHI